MLQAALDDLRRHAARPRVQPLGGGLAPTISISTIRASAGSAAYAAERRVDLGADQRRGASSCSALARRGLRDCRAEALEAPAGRPPEGTPPCFRRTRRRWCARPSPADDLLQPRAAVAPRREHVARRQQDPLALLRAPARRATCRRSAGRGTGCALTAASSVKVPIWVRCSSGSGATPDAVLADVDDARPGRVGEQRFELWTYAADFDREAGSDSRRGSGSRSTSGSCSSDPR